MGLDEVSEEILSAGRAAAGAVIKEAEQEKERLMAEARVRAGATTEERMRAAEKRIAQVRVQELASAELEGKRARLSMERELLEAAAEQARAKLAVLPAARDESLLAELLKRYGGPGYKVYSAAKNEAFLRAQPSVMYGGNITCLGGILFESMDTTVRMDYTYDTMLKDVVEGSMKEIARMLFAR